MSWAKATGAATMSNIVYCNVKMGRLHAGTKEFAV